MTHTVNTVDQISDKICEYVIFHSKDFNWEFLALKINLTRLNLKISMMNKTEAVIKDSCNELRTLLRRSITIPHAQQDLEQILSIQV